MPARVLLIEDNPANLDLMTYLLHAYGYTALAAEDGFKGLATARQETPDLIICDVQMPAMDGFEVARHVKSDPVLRTIPIVAVTALAMVGDRDRVLAAGFDGYIAKPINPETFVRQVEAFLPSRHYEQIMKEVRGLRNVNEDSTASASNSTSSFTATLPGSRHSILVVDNLPINLDLARSILEPHGYEVITADGMTQALAIARQRHFDLILSDVCMSEGSGYDLIQAIKADPQLAPIPFVFITSTLLLPRDRAEVWPWARQGI